MESLDYVGDEKWVKYFFYIIIYVLKIVLPKPDGPLWWRWSSFPVALSWTPAKAAESWIQG